MTTVVAASKSQRAYDWIRQRITTGTYGPGYRLVLTTLANDLGMSVVPVREAIRRLTAEGLVAFEHNVGASVAMVDAAQYRNAMQVISVVESAATALAAPYLTAADLDRARELNEVMRSGLADLDSRLFSALNEEFHHILYARCPNPRLLEVVEVEWARLGHLRDSIFAFVPGRPRESVCEHDRIVDLIARQAAPEEIERAVRGHRSGSLAAFLAHRHLTEGA
jgi:DNA-binding GntR family transcriptional regulator